MKRRFSVDAMVIWFCMVVSASAAFAQDPPSATFEFGDGRPFGGLTTLGDVTVQLLTTNTEPWGATSFRDQETGIPAEIVFCFSRPVTEFHISFSRLLAGETLRSFAQGAPTQIVGDIIDQGDGTFTVGPEVGDYGEGSLIWRNLDTQLVSLVIDNPPGWATAVDSFAITPLPLANSLSQDSSSNDTSNAAPCEQLSEGASLGHW